MLAGHHYGQRRQSCDTWLRGQASFCLAWASFGPYLTRTSSFCTTELLERKLSRLTDYRRSTHHNIPIAAIRNIAAGAVALANGGQELITPRFENNPFSA